MGLGLGLGMGGYGVLVTASSTQQKIFGVSCDGMFTERTYFNESFTIFKPVAPFKVVVYNPYTVHETRRLLTCNRPAATRDNIYILSLYNYGCSRN